MSSNGQSAVYEKQRRHEHHTRNLQQQGEGPADTTAILKALSEIDDLPDDFGDDAVMGQLVSKLASTANLSAEQVRSNEWVREYIMLLYSIQFPPEYGMTGAWRGWAHASADAERGTLASDGKNSLEAFTMNSKLAVSRSDDAKVIEEATRNVSESHVHNDNDDGDGGGGILGAVGLR